MKNNNFFYLLLLLSFLGLLWVPFDPLEQAFREKRFEGSGWPHLLGIDGLGRDLLSRLWRGMGNTVFMGLGAVLLTGIVSTVCLFLERQGGWVFKRSMPMVMSVGLGLPVIFVSILLMIFLSPSVETLIIAVGLGNTPLSYRQLRMVWLEHCNAAYVKVSQCLGSRGYRLFRIALWPNLWPDVAALGKLLFAMSVLEISGLAFLGLVGDPDFPELGTMLRQNQAYLLQDVRQLLLPGLLLTLILMIVHLTKVSDIRED